MTVNITFRNADKSEAYIGFLSSRTFYLRQTVLSYLVDPHRKSNLAALAEVRWDAAEEKDWLH